MNGVAASAKKMNTFFCEHLCSLKINLNTFFFVFFEKIFFDERGCCKCEKKYTMLVHNLKTSKTGVFDVIKGVNSPPQARKKSLFHFLSIQLKGIPPPWWGGGV